MAGSDVLIDARMSSAFNSFTLREMVYQMSMTCSLEITSKADITQEDSAILVNLLDENADLRDTRVGMAFNSACPKLWKFLEQAKLANPGAQVLETVGPFPGLPSTCQAVYHVILQKYYSQGTSENNLAEIVETLIDLATKAKQKSIAIPPLGCGRVHGYPASVVAEAVIQGLLSSVSQCYLNRVVLLCGDQPLMQAYKTVAERVFLPASPGLETQKFFSHAEESRLYDSRDWTKQALQQIEMEAQKLDVKVEIHDKGFDDKICFLVKGEKVPVQLFMKTINKINLHTISKMPKCIVRSGAPARGTIEFIEHASRCEEYCPSYWNMFAEFEPNQDNSQSCPLVDIDGRTHRKIAGLVYRLFDSHTGIGRDASGLNHGGIRITKIQRVENPHLFKLYSNQRKHLFERQSKQGSLCHSISGLKNSSGPVATYENLPSFMKSELYHEINEHYLFHGTDVMDLIINNGPDFRVGNEGLFGRGFYMAEKAAKSDQYTDKKGQRVPNGNELTLILMRALLGNAFVFSRNTPQLTGTYRLCRPPCTKCYKDKCSCVPANLFDSVLADGWLYREFIVYEKNNCYPEYVIFYTRNNR